jgi:hypothetical protein
MLEQLKQSLEPLLETHGLWFALGLLLFVLVPTLVLFFLRIQQRQGLNSQLQELLDAAGLLYNRLSATDHTLRTYQEQAEAYTGKTLLQVQPLSAPLSESLAQIHRCKVQIKEWEASLSEQDTDDAQESWSRLDKEGQELVAGVEKVEGFFLRLQEVEQALQNQLHQIAVLLEPYATTQAPPLLTLKQRLAQLDDAQPTTDPLADLEIIRQLLQDTNQWIQNQPKQETIEPESVEPESVEPESVEPESVEPESVEPESVEPESVEPESVQPESVAELDSILDQAFEQELVPEDAVVAEPVLNELGSEPLPESREDSIPVVSDANDLVLANETPTLETTSEVPDAAAEVPEVKDTEQAVVQMFEDRDSIAKIEAQLKREESQLLIQEERLLPLLEQTRQSLAGRFVPALWESSQKAFEQAQYKAQEAVLLLQLARRLQAEPAAPVHRILLNIQRSGDKWREIAEFQERLQTQYTVLEQSAEQAQKDAEQLTVLLGLSEFDSFKDTVDYQKSHALLLAVSSLFQSGQILDLTAIQTDLAWVAQCIYSWKSPSNPEEESMVAL